MSRRITLLSVALIFAATLAQADTPPNKAKLQQVLDAWSSMDLSRPAAFYAHDAGLAFYDIAPRSYNNWAEYENGVRELFKTVSSVTLKLASEPKVHRSGNLAWTTALVDGELVNKDGSRMPINARWTTIWEKRTGTWRIVHDHFSMPLPEPPPTAAH